MHEISNNQLTIKLMVHNVKQIPARYVRYM